MPSFVQLGLSPVRKSISSPTPLDNAESLQRKKCVLCKMPSRRMQLITLFQGVIWSECFMAVIEKRYNIHFCMDSSRNQVRGSKPPLWWTIYLNKDCELKRLDSMSFSFFTKAKSLSIIIISIHKKEEKKSEDLSLELSQGWFFCYTCFRHLSHLVIRVIGLVQSVARTEVENKIPKFIDAWTVFVWF